MIFKNNKNKKGNQALNTSSELSLLIQQPVRFGFLSIKRKQTEKLTKFPKVTELVNEW